MIRALLRYTTRTINKLIEKEIEKIVISTVHQVPITKFSEQDIFVIGYPKSGNTWLQHLCVGVLYGLDPKYVPDSLVQELHPDVHYKRFYKRYRTPMTFMSHHLPRPDYRRVVYLVRDGRDVMVSYYHYNKALGMNELDWLSMVKDGKGLSPCRWHEHVEAWLSNPYGAEMIIIRYEDLQRDCLAQLRRLCEFIGEERDEDLLRKVAMGASFENMLEKEIRFGWDNLRWPKDKFFVRRGKIGSYKDEMPPEALEVFLAQASCTLKKLGYI